MKITLAKSAGFCFGVKRALKIALEVAKSGHQIEMLGDIVHNEDVVKEIEKSGIKKISRLKNGWNKILLIRAHGTSKNTIKKAELLHYKVVDATCPMVKEIHKIVIKEEAGGRRIIIIGDKKHDEVRGIAGQIKGKAIIIDSPEKMPLKRIGKISKACVVVQSTQNLSKVTGVLEKLKTHINDLRFFNTICSPTKAKQQEIQAMPLQNDVMIIIGSKNSANTKRLYEISKSLNKRTFWVQSKGQIKKEWFKNASSVGITSGSSTPDSTTQKIIRCIKMGSDPILFD